jgi:signal transduction histidine kinase
MASEPSDRGAAQDQPAASGAAPGSEIAALAVELFAPLAHDLRAGLNGISLWTHLLSPDGGEVSERALEGIRRAVAHHSILAQELSQFGEALAAQRSGSPEPVNLLALCEQVVGELRASSPEHRIGVRALDTPAVTTHVDALRQVVRLLLLDAVAATPAGTVMELALGDDAGQRVLEIRIVQLPEALPDTPRRPSLRLALAALAAGILGGQLEMNSDEPAPHWRLRLP